jgi:hypothetical protein
VAAALVKVGGSGESLGVMGGVKVGETADRGKVGAAVWILVGLDPAEQPASIKASITNACIDFHISESMERVVTFGFRPIYSKRSL